MQSAVQWSQVDHFVILMLQNNCNTEQLKLKSSLRFNMHFSSQKTTKHMFLVLFKGL